MIAETLPILFNQNKSCKIRKVDLGSNHCFPEFQKFNFLDKNKSLLHLKNKNCPMWPVAGKTLYYDSISFDVITSNVIDYPQNDLSYSFDHLANEN